MKEKGQRAVSGMVCHHDRALALVGERWIMLYVVSLQEQFQGGNYSSVGKHGCLMCVCTGDIHL